MNHDFETWQALLLQKPHAVEEYPFDAVTAVYKIGGKMFALLTTEGDPLRITLKCDPDEVEGLRTQYPAIRPGYYMHKRHWNTVTLDSSVPESELLEMAENSYRLVIAALPKVAREALRIEK